MPPHSPSAASTPPWVLSLAFASTLLAGATYNAWAQPDTAGQAFFPISVDTPAPSSPAPTVRAPEPAPPPAPIAIAPLPAVEPIIEHPDPPPILELTDLDLGHAFNGDDCPGCGMG